jgi:hypothetical protein
MTEMYLALSSAVSLSLLYFFRLRGANSAKEDGKYE